MRSLRLCMWLSLAGLVAVVFWYLQAGPHHKSQAHPRTLHARPVDPVTGMKLNWITYLYRHSEAFREAHMAPNFSATKNTKGCRR